MNDHLAELLAPLLGAGVTVENLLLLTGGASRSTYAFDAVTGERRHRLILRTAPAAEHYAGMELEAAAQKAAADAGAPVPTILLASDSPGALGNPFLICDEVPGETIVRRIQRRLDSLEHTGGRALLLTQCARALADIHRARTDAAGLQQHDQLSEYRQRLDEMGDTTATFEWTIRWLEANRPRPSPARLVHGDFRMGNLIVDGSTLAAVLDWELVHIGEIYEDLSWFCIRAWRFGAPASMAAGGLGGIEEFVAAYEQAGGAAVDRDALHWWLVLATLRWGVICRMQAERHLSGQMPSVELAVIGRRVCETEWDLLTLLSPPTAAKPPDPPQAAKPPDHPTAAKPPDPASELPPPPNALYGRPTAAELVAAVADFLAGEVRAHTTGSVNFHALVAANALRIVEREILDTTLLNTTLLDTTLLNTTAAEVHAALASMGFADEKSLANSIRKGDLDARDLEVLDRLRTLVGHRLAVAHPDYAQGR